MRTTIFLSTLYLVFGFFACSKGEDDQTTINWTNRTSQLFDHNEAKISVSEGFAGTLILRDGDCMPGGNNSSTCRQYPVKRTIRVYANTGFNQAQSSGNSFFSRVDTKLIATISTDNEGFFQYSIAPGTYSLFIEEDGKLYANTTDGWSINPVKVAAGKATTVNVQINYATD